MRRRLVAGGADFEHRLERAFARGSAGAEGHREEARLQLAELLPGLPQLRFAFRRLGRKELEAEGARVFSL